MGGKYKWKPDENPAIGSYDTDRYFKSMTKSKSAYIKLDTSPYRRPKERMPDPGSYDKHLTSMGATAKSFTIGVK